MQSKTVIDLKKRLRNTFGDTYKIQWSDALLDKIIIEAQREYALHTGGLVGRYKLSAGLSPVQNLPQDFFKIIRALDTNGKEIPIVSYRKLASDYGDFRKIIGDKVKSICCNFDGFGKIRIFPILPENTPIGELIYKRLPKDNILEVRNIFAIEQHALFQMFQFTGKSQAKNCYLAFIEQVNRDKSKNLSNGSKNIQRTGVYF